VVTIVLDLLALSCALATVFYVRSSRHRQRFVRLIEGDAGTHPEALALACRHSANPRPLYAQPSI